MAFFSFHMSMWKNFHQNTQYWSRFVMGPSNTLSAGMYVYTFQPGNFTGWGSEGVNGIGHGGSSDWLYSLLTLSCCPSSHQLLISHPTKEIYERVFCCYLGIKEKKQSGTHLYWYACDLCLFITFMAAQPFAHTDLPSSLAFDLVTHYDLVHSERS